MKYSLFFILILVVLDGYSQSDKPITKDVHHEMHLKKDGSPDKRYKQNRGGEENGIQQILTTTEIMNYSGSKITIRYSMDKKNWLRTSILNKSQISLDKINKCEKYYVELCQYKNARFFCDTLELQLRERYVITLSGDKKSYVLRVAHLE